MNKVEAYLAAVQARDHAMLMFASIALSVTVLMILYYRPRQDRSSGPISFIPNNLSDLVMVIGCILRIAVWLVPDNLWYDEAFTAAVVSSPLEQAWTAIMADVHPPLWYLVTGAITDALGHSELVLRLPALLCSIGALVLFNHWLRNYYSPIIAMIAVLLMALAPVNLRFAAEARCYAALQLAAVSTIYGATTTNRDSSFFFVGATIAPWLHHLGWFITWTGGFIWLLRYGTKGLSDLLCAVILASPAAAIGIFQLFGGKGLGSGMLESGYWISDKGVGAYLYHAVYQNFFATCTSPKGWLEWAVGLISLGLWLVAIFGAFKIHRWDLALFAFLPGVAVWIISYFRPMLLGRTLIGTTPAVYLLIAYGLDQLRLHKRIWMGAVATVVLLFLIGAGNQLFGHARGTITGLFEATRTCQTVTHSEPSSVVLAHYYAPDQHNVLWDGFEPGLQTGAMTLETEQALGIERGDFADCLIYADHPAVPRENLLVLDPEIADRELVYTLTDDEFSHIALYK